MNPIVVDVHEHYTPALIFERFDAHAAHFPGVKLVRSEKSAALQFPAGEPPRAIMSG